MKALACFLLLISSAALADSNYFAPFPTVGQAIGARDPSNMMSSFNLDAGGNLLVNVAAGGGSGGTSSSFGAIFPGTGTAAGFMGNTGNMAPGLLDPNGYLEINCIIGCTGGGGGTSSSFGATFPLVGTAVGFKDISGNMAAALLDSNSLLQVNCAAGCSGGTFNNNSDAVATSATNGQSAAWLYGFNGTTWDRLRVDASKNLNVNLSANSFGTLTIGGTVSVSNFPATQPISGSVSVSNFPGTQAVSGTVTANQGTPPWSVKPDGTVWTLTGTSGNVNVTNTVPVSGTVTSNQGGAPWTVKPDGTVWTLTGTSANMNLTNASIAATQSGNWTSRIVGNAGAIFDAAQATAAPANNLNVAGVFNNQTGTTSALTAGNSSAIQLDNHGLVLMDLQSEAGTAITNVPTAIGTKGAGNVISVNIDTTSIAGTATVTAAAGVQKVGIVGNANAAIDAANNGSVPANVIADGFEAATQTTTQPTAATAGNMRRAVVSTDGDLYVRPYGPVIWSCGLSAIAATLTQCQAAPAAGLRLYITDVITQSNTSTAGLFTLRFGTGTNCATGTGNLFFGSASALMASPANTVAVNHFHLTTPIAVTAANAVCVLGVATNTTNIQINGYTAP